MTAAARARPRSSVSQRAPERDWRAPLARFGLVGKGVLHLVVGLSIWRLATGAGSGSEASSSGAVRWIADQPYGTPVLWLLAASLLALAGWRAVATIAGDPVDDDGLIHRAGFAAKAVVYGGLGVICVITALSTPSSGGSSAGSDDTQQASRTVFDLPMGRWLVFLVGVAVMALAVHLAVIHAFDGRFLQRLRVGEESPAARLGRIGYGLRSVAYLFVGFFLAHAGLTYQPEDADGLSGSLRRVAEESWGSVVLYASAIGFVAYGAYCFSESRLRRGA